MKHKLPNLNRLLGLVLPAVLAGAHVLLAQPPPSMPPSTPPAPASGPHAEDSRRLLAEARGQLALHRSVEAKIRHRVSIFGRQMHGAGGYWQQGVGDQLRLRMELKLRHDEQISSLLQIADGRHLWIRRDLAGVVTLSRIDIGKVRRAAGPRWQPDWRGMLSGGLPRLLDAIDSRYEFAAPQAAELGGEKVWRLRGSEPKGEAPPPADHPQYVELMIGRGPVKFPYRIAFLGRVESEEGPRLTPLVTMELYEVRLGRPLPAEQFQFPLSDLNPTDRTAEFIDRLGLNLPPAEGAGQGARSR